jgi:heme/copper-type cytochrome/quinol oxidase subunit 2
MQNISKKVIAVSIAAAAIIVGLLLVIPTVQHSANNVSTGTSSKTVYFTIIESDRGNFEGMNGSAFHLGEAWPVMEVNVGDTVIIRIISMNASEVHGFTITHYFDPGVGLLPGGQYTVKFIASEAGTFIVTCLLFCAIHPLMDYGKFIVNSTAA